MLDERNALERRPAAMEQPTIQSGYPRPAEYEDGYGQGMDEEGIKIDFYRWFRGILKRKWMIATIVALITSIAIIEAYRTRDTYQAYAVIAVGKEDTSLVKSGDSGEWIIQNDETLRTKAYQIQSTSLIEDVVVALKLDQDLKILDPGKRPLKEAFNRFTDRMLRKEEPKPDGSKIDAEFFSEKLPGAEFKRTPMESWRLEPYVTVFKEKLAVDTISDTRLLKVTFTHHDPILAATACNALTEIFIRRNFEGKSEKYHEASDWLVRTERELKAKAEKAEQALADYTRRHSNFVPQGKGSLSLEKLTRLHGEVTRAETERILKESLVEEVKRGRIAQLPEMFTDPTIGELQKRLGELSVTAAQLDVNYGPDNPQTLEVQQQIAAIQKQIESRRKGLEEKLKIEYERAARDETALKVALAGAKSEGAQENQDAVQYNILQQEVDTAKSLYRSFLEKSNHASFELAQQQNNLRVMEPARIPRITIAPNRKIWISIGFIMSLLIGIGLALLLEFLDHTIKNTDEVSRQTQLPVLAVIPAIGEKEPQRSLWQKIKHMRPSLSNGASAQALATVPGNTDSGPSVVLDGHSPASEAYRLLRTSLLMSTESFGYKTLLFTSSQPGDGKTTTTINTAISLAQLGKSVLIIDCDLRTPNIHKQVGISQGTGLSTFLSNNAKLNRAIWKSKIPGLSLIPSGPIPHNPAELISTQKMREMLHDLGQRFDYILIDSPPLIHLADSIILSRLVDGVVLVVHGGKTERDAARRTRQELSNAGANIIGVVLNNIPIKEITYYSYYSQPQ
jgi:capsular exopolysaccharide synthesis family protein